MKAGGGAQEGSGPIKMGPQVEKGGLGLFNCGARAQRGRALKKSRVWDKGLVGLSPGWLGKGDIGKGDKSVDVELSWAGGGGAGPW